jgi:anti-sigma factor RsiW
MHERRELNHLRARVPAGVASTRMVHEDVDDAMGLTHGLLGMASRRRTRRRTFAKLSLSDISAARASAIGGMAQGWQPGTAWANDQLLQTTVLQTRTTNRGRRSGWAATETHG